jgi:hypothetical protein
MAPAILFFLSSLALFAGPSLAVPNVTAVLIPDCSAFPSDGFIPILNQSDNSTIEGYGDDVQLIRHTGDTGITSGRVRSLNPSNLPSPLPSIQIWRPFELTFQDNHRIQQQFRQIRLPL